MSERSLAGYDNRDAVSGGLDEEVYLYDGMLLVFSSYGQLRAVNTDSAKDVYWYDAVTGVLVRVSVGEEGL